MDVEIITLSKVLTGKSVARQRDFHKHPGTAWFEMRASVIIAKALTELGYEVLTRKAVCAEQARIGVLPKGALEEYAALAMKQEAPVEYLTEEVREGYTGMIGILRCGEGPAVALRFDIDALGLHENGTDSHRPYREGLASVNEDVMHACGHDGHAAIGLRVAKVLIQLKDQLHGTVKLLFRPGEEGTKGARAMVVNGHPDDVDFFTGTHIAPDDGPDDGDVTPDTYGSLATTKYDVYYHGQASHAGGFPEKGASAIVAVANMVVSLAVIPRHSGGISRINVGIIEGGTGRNAMPDEAKLQIGVRGETMEINRYMEDCARRICEGAVVMCGCICDMVMMGTAESQQNDEDFLMEIGQLVREELPHLWVSSYENTMNWGSEDISLMMNRVQEHDGRATYMRSMTPMASVQHTIGSDFDEKVLTEGIQTFATIVCHFMK